MHGIGSTCWAGKSGYFPLKVPPRTWPGLWLGIGLASCGGRGGKCCGGEKCRTRAGSDRRGIPGVRSQPRIRWSCRASVRKLACNWASQRPRNSWRRSVSVRRTDSAPVAKVQLVNWFGGAVKTTSSTGRTGPGDKRLPMYIKVARTGNSKSSRWLLSAVHSLLSRHLRELRLASLQPSFTASMTNYQTHILIAVETLITWRDRLSCRRYSYNSQRCAS